MKRNVLCIIPARGGSKRIPRKNVQLLGGIPLIAHSIQHALDSSSVTKVIVSTDDTEIIHIASSYGVEALVRPKELSNDTSTSESALLHALDSVERSNFHPDLIVFLQCTSPIRERHDIDNAVEQLEREGADSLFSVCRNDRFLWRKINGQLTSLNYDYNKRMRDQDHPEEYRENGSIYVFKPEILKRHNNRLGGRITAYEMDYWSSFQIDTREHFQLCEFVLKPKREYPREATLPFKPTLIVSDFDGVLTDNKVFVNQQGVESVICDRSDSWGLTMLKRAGIKFVILSTESNPVVKVRCDKLGVACYQGSLNKWESLRKISRDYDTPLESIIYVGNDTNDLECVQNVGFGVAVADSHPDLVGHAKIVLSHRGGHGAIRELCDLALKKPAPPYESTKN